jgi:hypothetical protein
VLNCSGPATLLLDLLTPAEERDRRNVSDIPLLHRPPAAGVLFTIAVGPSQLPPRLASCARPSAPRRTLERVELFPLSRDGARDLVGPRPGLLTVSRQLSLDDLDGPRGLTRAELMTAAEVAELLDVRVSTSP